MFFISLIFVAITGPLFGRDNYVFSKLAVLVATVGTISWLGFGVFLALYYKERGAWARFQRGADGGYAELSISWVCMLRLCLVKSNRTLDSYL
jgi:hypothetical protein